MNTPLSLVQELRGIRAGHKHTQSEAEGLLSEIREAQQKWKAEVDQANQILRDLLLAISELSGVELPGVALDSQKPTEALLRMDFKTVKDRIRNDLESYANASALEMGKHAQGTGHVALDGLQQEISGRLDNLAEEFRAKARERIALEQSQLADEAKSQVRQAMQAGMDDFSQWIKLMGEGVEASVPVKIEGVLEPQIKEVSERFVSLFRQELQYIAHEHEQLSRNKIQELNDQAQAQITSLGREARQFCEQNAESAMKSFTERVNAAADEGIKKIESKVTTSTEESLGGFRQQLKTLSAASQKEVEYRTELQTDIFKQKLEDLAQKSQESYAATISEQVGKIADGALASSLQQIRQQVDQAIQASKGDLQSSMQTFAEDVRKQIAGLAQSAKESLSQDAAGFSNQLKSLGEELKRAEEMQLATIQERLAALTRTATDSAAAGVKQAADAQLEQIRKTLDESRNKVAADYELRLKQGIEAQYNAALARLRQETDGAASQASEQIKARSERVVQELSEKVNKEVNTSTELLQQWARQTTAWAESSIKTSLESYKSQLSQLGDSVIEEQRKSISLGVGSLQNRLEQAARLLHGLEQEELAHASGANGNHKA